MTVQLLVTADGLDIVVPRGEAHTVFVALDTDPFSGSAVLPFGIGAEGSTVFLPIRADRLYRLAPDGSLTLRLHQRTMWGEATDAGPCEGRIAIRRAAFTSGRKIGVVVYMKAMEANDGWGRMVADARFGAAAGSGDQYVTRYEEVEPTRIGEVMPAAKSRLEQPGGRMRIYQLLPRLFGNMNETRQPNGTLRGERLREIRRHQRRGARVPRARWGSPTSGSPACSGRRRPRTIRTIGLPADDPDLLKGHRRFAVCDQGLLRSSARTTPCEPAERLAEFRALLARIHAAGLGAIIDFVPNHVARSYRSIVRPEHNFGAQRRPHAASSIRANNFFYLQPDSPGGGPPLRLPTVRDGQS